MTGSAPVPTTPIPSGPQPQVVHLQCQPPKNHLYIRILGCSGVIQLQASNDLLNRIDRLRDRLAKSFQCKEEDLVVDFSLRVISYQDPKSGQRIYRNMGIKEVDTALEQDAKDLDSLAKEVAKIYSTGFSRPSLSTVNRSGKEEPESNSSLRKRLQGKEDGKSFVEHQLGSILHGAPPVQQSPQNLQNDLQKATDEETALDQNVKAKQQEIDALQEEIRKGEALAPANMPAVPVTGGSSRVDESSVEEKKRLEEFHQLTPKQKKAQIDALDQKLKTLNEQIEQEVQRKQSELAKARTALTELETKKRDAIAEKEKIQAALTHATASPEIKRQILNADDWREVMLQIATRKVKELKGKKNTREYDHWVRLRDQLKTARMEAVYEALAFSVLYPDPQERVQRLKAFIQDKLSKEEKPFTQEEITVAALRVAGWTLETRAEDIGHVISTRLEHPELTSFGFSGPSIEEWLIAMARLKLAPDPEKDLPDNEKKTLEMRGFDF